jgi:hypothetical protein
LGGLSCAAVCTEVRSVKLERLTKSGFGGMGKHRVLMPGHIMVRTCACCRLANEGVGSSGQSEGAGLVYGMSGITGYVGGPQ